MKNIIADRVKNATLTKSQQKIADYCIRSPERVGMSSSMEVAKAIGVSDASITRFARAIGYDGFSELKNDIYSNLANQATGGVNTLSLAERFDVNQAKYGGGSRAEYMNVLQYNLERTFQQNSEEQFDKAVELLLNAKHRYSIGFRGCLGIASQFAWLLRFLLDHVVSVNDEGSSAIGTLQDVTDEDCVVLFSVSRYYKGDVALAQLTKKRCAKLCIVTDSLLSPFRELADVLLVAETGSSSFFHSTMALNLISEYLLTRISLRCSDSYQQKVTERDELTGELRL